MMQAQQLCAEIDHVDASAMCAFVMREYMNREGAESRFTANADCADAGLVCAPGFGQCP